MSAKRGGRHQLPTKKLLSSVEIPARQVPPVQKDVESGVDGAGRKDATLGLPLVRVVPLSQEIFDPATVIDRATYEDGRLPSAGIPYVIVGGQPVVDGGQVTSARPGRAIRAPIR